MALIVHVRPVDDAIGHEASADCACGPLGQLAPRGLGLIFHHQALLPCHEWEAAPLASPHQAG